MIYSLRTRFFLIFVAIIILAVTAVALLANRGTANEFGRYVARRSVSEQMMMRHLLEPPIQQGDLAEAQELAETIGQVYGRSITLTDDEGTIIIASAPDQVGTQAGPDYSPPPSRPPIGIHPEGIDRGPPVIFLIGPDRTIEFAVTPSANAYVPFRVRPDMMDERVDSSLDDSEQTFLGSVNRSFLAAALLAITATILLSFGFSKRIFGPIEALTIAAHELEKGDLSQQVSVTGKDEIGTLARAFNKMAQSLARQEQLRRHMVTDVAHELRTPLSNIRGYLEALQDGILEPDKATIDSLHEETMLLNYLIEDLQALSLAEAGQLRCQCHPLSLHDSIEQAINSVQLQAQEQAIALHYTPSSPLPPVLADGERVSQILRNLLGNAIAHTPPGGSITITAVAAASEVKVSIQDTGHGIAPEHLPHVFDRFYRADESRTRATGGTGLGLAIVKAFVEMQNGRVAVESTPGAGATFSFTLPTASDKSSSGMGEKPN